ncbi:PAS domain-containing protein [Streptomyces sp. MST-110588]|uniref:PAS domain-containing protein n=1 Tax=Streptomyces sp. MST-110588 TaxID=2833628 RepID=UPI001F5CDE6C|nr:PAS domain-containing protein [Streptomyces sp. MST-110588]
MAGAEQMEADLKDFRRRVEELRAARALPSQERLSVLDAALFELQHVVDVFLPRFERQFAAERDNGSRRDAEEQHLLRALFQRMPFAVALLGPDAVVRRLNFAGTRLFGVRAGYAAGRPLTASLAPETRAAFRSQVAAVARNEGDRSLVVRLLPAPDGSRQEGESLRVTMTALRPPGEPGTSVLTVFHTGADALTPGRSDGVRHAAVPRPGLAEVTRNAELMDLLDDITSALLEAPREATAALDRAARVLYGRFADWVIADVVTRGGGPLRRVTVLGPDGLGAGGGSGTVTGAGAGTVTGAGAGAGAGATGTGSEAGGGTGPSQVPCGPVRAGLPPERAGHQGHEDSGKDRARSHQERERVRALAAVLAGQDPAHCPLVTEAARSGNANLQVRPEDLGVFGYDPDGAPILAGAAVTSLLCVPLQSKAGPVRGVLTLFRTGGRRAFSMAEAGTVDRISRHLGLALRP